MVTLVAAPMVYAQFFRQTGDSDWGYGYGYGFDGGTFAGYRTGDNPEQYLYGYGYGYLEEGVTYGSETGFSVEPEDISSLVQSGILIPNGADVSTTTDVTFNSLVTLNIGSDVVITIPSGTTFTASESTDFSQLAAASGANTTGLPSNFTSIAGLQFGLPNLGLTVDPAITIEVNVGSSYNGQSLKIYRKDAGGSWANTGTTCLVASGICSFTTTHLSSFAVGKTVTTSSSSNSSGGGGIAVYCNEVVYGNWSTCINGFQYRDVVSKTPTLCNLSTSQQLSRTRICTTDEKIDESENAETSITSTVNVKEVMNREKALVTKVNTKLINRLLGRILLQVEEKGQAWYLEPISKQKHFMGHPTDAFVMMRRFGLGISEANFSKFEKSGVPTRFSGRIFLRVEAHGEAYYINPVDMKLHYLGRPADAFNIMKNLALGISNANIRQIPVGEVK